jgi:diadenosine tetraphosphatase ApaH/serine/threonine PP2A family protein phosphatase
MMRTVSASVSPLADASFSLPARTAVSWTRSRLTQENAWFLENLPVGPLRVEDLYHVSHGSPLGEDDYLLEPRDALDAFDGVQDLCFFGHSHVPGGFELDERAQTLTLLTFQPGKWFQLREGCKYLVNPGSLGQPRDRDPRLSFLTYDPPRRRVRLHRLPYDHAGAAQAILEAGLHPNLAERLHHGI